MFEVISDFHFGDTTARYVTDPGGRVGLILFPTSLADSLAQRRATLRGEPFIDSLPDPVAPPAVTVDSLVHLKIVGDSYSGAFAQGRTMRDAPSIDRFKLISQTPHRDGTRTIVTTRLDCNDGIVLHHHLAWHDGEMTAEISTEIINGSPQAITLEMLSSFALGGITPFDSADAPGRIRVHRYRSVWSAEGRRESQSIEQLHLERSWSGAGLFSERFGQVGTMPVRGWFPFVALEDTGVAVTWGAQLAWAGSWQIEIARRHDDVSISGGLADRELGHWCKTLAIGESIIAPSATVACVRGNVDDLCDRLTEAQGRAVDRQPLVEQDLPIVFNEWCTTWGDPQHDRLVRLAERLAGTPVKYLVIDAGWYKMQGGDWGNGHGDWIPSLTLFPNGLAAIAREIKKRGLIPGLWFEMETVGDASTAFLRVDHLLKRDGIPITVRNRRFWNLEDEAAVDDLAGRVISTLRDGGFGYLKVDYNETVGIGCDGSESQGEGLRKHVLGIYRVFDRIRRELPELVIENCSSGGHRLEPSMLARTAMSSFSDAHELPEIPIIASNLHAMMLPRQIQIWAVLHGADDDRRLYYSLAATFLGRMCLSGDIDALTESQWQKVQNAMQLYRMASSIIRDGTSRRFQEIGQSWRHPTGWQACVRTADDGDTILMVVHTFAGDHSCVRVTLPAGGWSILATLTQFHPNISNGLVIFAFNGEYSAEVVLLRRIT